jgi:hypothetical protein
MRDGLVEMHKVDFCHISIRAGTSAPMFHRSNHTGQQHFLEKEQCLIRFFPPSRGNSMK